MDPNACLTRIVDAFRDDDTDECDAAMSDLAEWLDKGGFAPSATGAIFGVNRFSEPIKVIHSSEHRLSIMTIDPHSTESGWQLVRYNVHGRQLAAFPFFPSA